MKKQALKTLTMLSLVLMLTAVSVCAQSERSKFTNIPFNFIVGQKTLLAGEYTVEPNRKDSHNVWLVRRRNGRTSALFTAVRANDGKRSLTVRRSVLPSDLDTRRQHGTPAIDAPLGT